MIKKITMACLGTLLAANTLLATDKMHTGKIDRTTKNAGYMFI